MNHAYRLSELCHALQGKPFHLAEQATFCRISTDSRKVCAGDLFFALSGETTDGHFYIQQALNQGAQAIVACAEKIPPAMQKTPVPLIAVADPNRALMDLAKDYRSRFRQGHVLGITGSNGKTSTKEIAAEICRALGAKTHATQGNFNNFIGVPLTLLAATLQEDWWVVEMGTNRFGEIKALSEIVKPNLGLITNIGESHLEFLESTQGVAKEKSGLFAGMAPQSMVAFPSTILHREIIEEAAAQSQIRRVTYGFDHWKTAQPAECSAKLLAHSPSQTQFEWLGQKVTTPIGNSLLLSNLLGVLTLLQAHGMAPERLAAAAQKLSYAMQGRMQFRQTRRCLLVDDTYNANPTSFQSVMAALKEMFPQRRLVVVAGAMAELGKQSPELHVQTGRAMHTTGMNQLLAFGENESRHYGEGWKKEGGASHLAFWTNDRQELVEFFQKIVQQDDVVLVKGSRSAQMEGFVQAIVEQHGI